MLGVSIDASTFQPSKDHPFRNNHFGATTYRRIVPLDAHFECPLVSLWLDVYDKRLLNIREKRQSSKLLFNLQPHSTNGCSDLLAGVSCLPAVCHLAAAGCCGALLLHPFRWVFPARHGWTSLTYQPWPQRNPPVPPFWARPPPVERTHGFLKSDWEWLGCCRMLKKCNVCWETYMTGTWQLACWQPWETMELPETW